MLRFAAGAAVAALLILPATLPADPAQRLPENTWAAVMVKDASQLREKWAATPLGQAYNGPEMEKFRTYLNGKIAKAMTQMEEEGFPRADEILASVKGEVTFFVADPTLDSNQELNSTSGMIMAVSEENKEAVQKHIDKFLGKLPADARKGSYEAEGFTVSTIQMIAKDADAEPTPAEGEAAADDAGIETGDELNIAYAMADGWFVLTEGKGDPIKGILASLKGGETATLSKSPAYQAFAAEHGSIGDFAMYFNYAPLVELAAQDESAAEGLAIFERTGLKDAGPMMISYMFEGKRSESTFTLMLPETNRMGLVALLSESAPVTTGAAGSVPASATSFFSWSLSGQVLFRELKAALMATAPPAYAMMNMSLEGIKTEQGLDIETDILNNISGQHLFYELPKPANKAAIPSEMMMPEQNPFVLKIALENGQGTVDALSKFLAKAMEDPEGGFPFERSEVAGFGVYQMKDQGMGMEDAPRPSFALTPKGLLLSFEMEGMQDALRFISGEGKGSIAETELYQSLAKLVPSENLRMVAFNSEKGLIEDYKALLEMARQTELKLDEEEADEPLIADVLPSAEALEGKIGNTIGAVQLKPRSLQGRSVQVVP